MSGRVPVDDAPGDLLSETLPPGSMELRDRILVADDDPGSRRLVQRVLERHFDVVAVEDGAAAWAAVRERVPAAVVLDLQMPHMTGQEVLARLRGDPDLAHVAVVLVSGLSDEASVVECLHHGADDFVIKPFRPSELRARVERALARSRRATELEAENGRRRAHAATSAEILHDMGNVLTGLAATAGQLLQGGDARVAEILSRLAERVDGRDGAEPPDAAALRRYLSTAADALARDARARRQAAEELSRRVNALVRLLERARRPDEVDVRPLSVSLAIADAVVLCRPLLERMSVRVAVDGPTGLHVLADAASLQQILVNFLRNAVDAMASSEDRALRIVVSDPGEHVEIAVIDTGVGFPPERAVELMRRGVSTKGAGRGLGLYSCARLARALSGSIEAYSDGLGRGARFVVRLRAAGVEGLERAG